MWILVSEGVGYHNQSIHFLYTTNPGPPKNHTYSTGLYRLILREGSTCNIIAEYVRTQYVLYLCPVRYKSYRYFLKKLF